MIQKAGKKFRALGIFILTPARFLLIAKVARGQRHAAEGHRI